MNNSAREDWKLDPENQSGVFLGFAHRRSIYGAQILVVKAVLTAKHQIAYDVELFPFQQTNNSNDRLQFLQSLLKRKTAPISDSALDNNHLNHAAHGWRIHCGVEVTELSTNKQHTLSNSATTEPYFPNSITIDDSFDDEQVANLMQDVDNDQIICQRYHRSTFWTRRQDAQRYLFTFPRRLI
jgi:hypothetical protein